LAFKNKEEGFHFTILFKHYLHYEIIVIFCVVHGGRRTDHNA